MIEELRLKLAERRRAVEGSIASTHNSNTLIECDADSKWGFQSNTCEPAEPSLAVCTTSRHGGDTPSRVDRIGTCQQQEHDMDEASRVDQIRACKHRKKNSQEASAVAPEMPARKPVAAFCTGENKKKKIDRLQGRLNEALAERDGANAQNRRLDAELKLAHAESAALKEELETLRRALQSSGLELCPSHDATERCTQVELPCWTMLCQAAMAGGQSVGGPVVTSGDSCPAASANPQPISQSEPGQFYQQRNDDSLESAVVSQQIAPYLMETCSANSCADSMPCVHSRARANDLLGFARIWDTVQRLRKEMSVGEVQHGICHGHTTPHKVGADLGLIRTQCNHLELKLLASRLQMESYWWQEANSGNVSG